MLIPSHFQLEPLNSRTHVPAGGINLIASIDFKSDGATTATLSSSTKVPQGDDAISNAEVATPNHSNQQYSIYAITDAAANIAERYAYTAYGQPTILDGSGTPLNTQLSTLNNRYTYTAREWDATVGLYHFRARWMSGVTGRFLTRDPIGYQGSEWNFYELFDAGPLQRLDWMGHFAIPCPAAGTASCEAQCAETGQVAVSCSCFQTKRPYWSWSPWKGWSCGTVTDEWATPVCQKYKGTPGKCTPQQHAWLRAAKDAACNGAGKPTPGMSCPSLASLFFKNLECAAARAVVAKRCFDDNDPDHKDLIDEHKQWAAEASSYYISKPCVPMPGLGQPIWA